MKSWSSDHPKAKLMASKRADILAAAKASFLDTGYEGTSMESIAKAANVSIMTLYRHAESKDDLFSAVISNACDPDDEAERAQMEALLEKPLRDVLLWAGMTAQSRLMDPDTIALMRTVIAGTSRFPGLAEMAHTSLVGNLEGMVAFMLGLKQETLGISAERRSELAVQFIDRLLGTHMLGVLMGLPGPSTQQQQERAEIAADALIAALGQPLSAER
ncbi:MULTISPECIES: TetR/AcrR family transcriptional regulator [Rhizobium]|jgi:TetR/AcrR family transcriptional repressor of mexJK operon|uniref:TetR/AcrR family transcriptional regulator n=1 Tax=Rhizobium TaxID=379 RepID=UPI0006472E35|nr:MULTISPECIES: TetR/AcrR family transcriptional regulator [Rhizobium]MBB3301629.1 TetR/AcrR family transcriptional repressor of mexJK operon [Rhizobium sp. BK112]MBB3370901.1 TetR/AcrR family transcriptional repressor of mexJK operon [Rhizobium sp. BK077]MBB3746862.1 TetR/AcrR family transcriptional repressor of mexJK operon [Rhizobium sp. BK591]MBB4115411.1 TetR/AcrR family transcriptional repressor of mexJK operon [Rhizobium sp. BK226]MBB4181669.1 TetR/AcrR family transcriptional repressor